MAGVVDAIVIGAGPAGEAAAAGLAAEGLEVALVERELVGGECAFYACMPSKALLRPGELLAEVQRVPGAREAVTGKLDPQVVLERRDEVVHDLDDTSKLPWVEDRGIALYQGPGEARRRAPGPCRRRAPARRAARSCSRSAVVPRSRRSRALEKSSRGRIAPARSPSTSRGASRSSAAGWSAASSRRRGHRSARR